MAGDAQPAGRTRLRTVGGRDSRRPRAGAACRGAHRGNGLPGGPVAAGGRAGAHRDRGVQRQDRGRRPARGPRAEPARPPGRVRHRLRRQRTRPVHPADAHHRTAAAGGDGAYGGLAADAPAGRTRHRHPARGTRHPAGPAGFHRTGALTAGLRVAAAPCVKGAGAGRSGRDRPAPTAEL
ncbi:hypothetical protein SCOCK_140200 [Actinacidiphila cocklensis]|uniref:Uncharacterized protein n=1 Tax=Actinacidiphila cocklensis TaxID=887465 RepID=A0A9W4DKU0_9ACTN|nr:hypothetical protein SCOCK_140200 [Actinacidiphila cocklensis]